MADGAEVWLRVRRGALVYHDGRAYHADQVLIASLADAAALNAAGVIHAASVDEVEVMPDRTVRYDEKTFRPGDRLALPSREANDLLYRGDVKWIRFIGDDKPTTDE